MWKAFGSYNRQQKDEAHRHLQAAVYDHELRLARSRLEFETYRLRGHRRPDEGKVREYIRNQEQLESGQGDLDLK